MAGPKLRSKFLRDRKNQSRSGNRNKTKTLHNTFTEGQIEALWLKIWKMYKRSITFSNIWFELYATKWEKPPLDQNLVWFLILVYTLISNYEHYRSIFSIKKIMLGIGHPSFAFKFVSLNETIKEVHKFLSRQIYLLK